DEDSLAEAYTLWALSEKNGRTASALQCARGVVDLVRGDFVEAEETLQRAADLDPKDVFCRAALAAVYRAGKRFDQLAHVLAELSSEPPLARRMQLQTEQAQLLTSLNREPEAVVAAYLDVLSIEPDQTEALAGIEGPARALGLWDELARAFRGAPTTPRNLEVLAEALAKIAEWSEL